MSELYERIRKMLPTGTLIDHAEQVHITADLLELINRELARQRVAISEALVEQSKEYAEAEKNHPVERVQRFYKGKSSGLMRASIIASEFEGGA